MDQITTPLPYITCLERFKSDKGDVKHGIKSSDKSFMGFGEAYFSTISKGTVKPWKKHKLMTLNIIVPVGKIKFVLCDQRKKSNTNGCFFEICLSLENYSRLTIPPNIWMAFQGVDENNMLLNIANISHDPNEIVRKELDFFNYKW